MLISNFLGRLGRSFATRLNENAFWETSQLGVSLRRKDFVMPICHGIAFENGLGLPAVSNRALERLDDAEAVVFVHDDFALYNFFLPHRVAEGLTQFDVIGVAGSVNPPGDHASFRVRLPAGEKRPTDAQPKGYVFEESGTWPIALGHASARNSGSSTWLSAIEQYRANGV